ncbi:hypothetical protein [Paraburkholderia sp. J8-2]|uniref:hypothetical protein n=1 Tax=Paraburkholderia sp. J8-2 TaxID=2805440 RepID=UPI002AB66C1E|nr:hypothetical protein [Paraburkholderia sp. J8-2]
MSNVKTTNAVSVTERALFALCLLASVAITIAVGAAAALYNLAALTHPDHALDHALAWGRFIVRSII